MKLRLLTVAMLAASPLIAQAGGIERATQSVEPLFEDGNYAELSYAWVDPKITGKDVFGNEIKDVSESYGMLGAAVKVAPSENTALAVFYDEPWGVDTVYPQGNMFANTLGATTAKVDTSSLTTLAGFKTDSNFWFYAGLEWQQAEGNVKGARPVGAKDAKQFVPQITAAVKPVVIDQVTKQVTSSIFQQKNLTQQTFAALPAAQQQAIQQAITTEVAKRAPSIIEAEVTKRVTEVALSPRIYNVQIQKTDTVVPLVGIAYEIPDIALRAALTYHAPAKHSARTIESAKASVLGEEKIAAQDLSGTVQFEFPQSVNLDFQTGIMADTLLMANVRWVNWKSFDVDPIFYKKSTGESLAFYDEDQISASVGIGRRFTDKLSAQVAVGYDTGTGEPYTLLGPYAETTDVGVGVKYAVTPNIDVSVGAKYLWLGDAFINDDNGNKVAEFTDNTGVAVGAKVGFHF